MNQETDLLNNKSTNRIFLLGFMGVGKSYWGKQWAEKHNFSFIDLDETIEKQEDKTVFEIFESNGENYFRQREAVILREIVNLRNCIISCGGGTPCFNKNMQWMNENGITVLLQASPTFIQKNISRENQTRPLIKDLQENELVSFIEQKLKERKVFYEAATYMLDAEKLHDGSLEEEIHLFK